MKTSRITTFSVIVALGVSFASTIRPVFADETPTADVVIEVARTAILDVPFDHDATVSVETTNGLKKVVFPRKASQSVHASSPAQFAATVFVDPTTHSVIPNPGLTALSDEQAIFIATNAVPIPYDHSKTVRVDRASSVIRVTLPDKNHESAPGVVVSNAPLAWIWIDVESQSVLWARMEAN